jgi:hypothetical protein
MGADAADENQQARRYPGLWHAQRLTLSSIAVSGVLMIHGFFASDF